jgi:hypothetical protein
VCHACTNLHSADATATRYIVAGGGGHAFQPVETAVGAMAGDHAVEASYDGYGYLLLTASATELQIDFHRAGGGAAHADSVTVPIS